MRAKYAGVATQIVRRVAPAVLASAAALMARLAIDPWVGDSVPYLTFFPAVAFAGYFGSLFSGVLAAVLGGLIADFFFLAPRYTFLHHEPGHLVAFAGYVLGSAAICLLIHSRTRAWHRAADAAVTRQRFAGIVESAMDAIIAVDEGQQVRAFNRAAEQIFGWPAAEALGQPLDRFIPDRFRAAHRAHVQQFGHTGVTTRSMSRPGTLWGLRRNGEEFPIEATISQIEAPGEKLFTVILRDVSDRVRAENALRERTEEMEALVKHMPALVWMAHDAECHRITGNAAAARLFNVTPDDNVSQSPGELSAFPVPNLDANGRVLQPDELPIQRAAATGRPVENAEVQLQLPGDRHVWIYGNATPLFTPEGKVRGVIGAFMDVTARKEAEVQLQASQERLQLAQRAAAMGTWEWNIRSGDVVWSDEVCLLHGVEPGSFDGRFESWLRTVHPDDRERAQATVREAMATGGSYANEYRTLLPDGRVCWTTARGQFFPDQAGRPARLVGVCMDVTQRKRAEEALHHAEKMVASARIAATLAHEINNPLAAITNLAYILRTHPGMPAELARFTQLLDDELQRISQIVRQTLNLYREEGKPPAAVRIADVVDHVLAIYGERLQSIAVEKRCEDSIIEANPAELHQLLSNLVLNAVEAIPGSGGAIKIRVHPARDWQDSGRPGVRIVIADNGVGMDAETRRRMFDPFFTTKARKGTGLGLSVVQWVAAKHGGRLRVRTSTQPGRSGTCVAVFLCTDAKRASMAAPLAARKSLAS